MDINIKKMTDETADRAQDSISILFFPPQETISLFKKSFVSHKADEEGPSSSKKWAKGCCSSDTNDKMNQARGKNGFDMNNDTIRSSVGFAR